MLQEHRSRRRGERGQTMALVAVSMISLLAMAALAIDVVTLYTARGQAERAADAAALAAAKVLADSGVTTDPNDASSPSIWTAACAAAVTEANEVANQNVVAGQTPSGVNVIFPAFGGSVCSGTNSTFGINPQVTVQVTVNSVPTFFAKIWSKASSLVSATAIAEAYNPSNSSIIATTGGTIGPNVARCVKPMLVPNCDPNRSGGTACGAGFQPFITNVGSSANIAYPGSPTSNPTGVIGEQFLLQSACIGAGPCVPPNPSTPMSIVTTPPSLAYYPLTFPVSVNLCPSCTPTTPTDYESSLACCNGTSIQCGGSYQLDTNESNLGGAGNQTQTAGQCLIHEVAAGTVTTDCSPSLDQDCLQTSAGPPYAMMAGTQNPLKNKTSGPGGSLGAGDGITVSDSVVSLPIYDVAGGNNPPASPPSGVTIIGFLQVFINDAAPSGGDMQVTVLNVVGCGSNPTGNAVNGSGPAVPVRLIHN